MTLRSLGWIMMSKLIKQFIEEAFEERFKKEASNNGNVDDAAIHHNEKAGVEIRGDAEKSIQHIEDDFKDRMKKEIADTENVDGATIHDTEKDAVEIRGNAGK